MKISLDEAKKRLKKMVKAKSKPIDYSDIPELTEKQLKQAKRRRGRPLLGVSARKLISIKLDTALVTELKKEASEEGIGYQTLIHSILEEHLKAVNK